MTTLDALRFPVGKFSAVKDSDNTMRAAWIDDIAATPAIIADLAGSMTAAQLNTPYRDGGWTAAQVIHHMADSHANAYIRTRFVLAEDNFTVKPYDENRWAQFSDAMSTDVMPSIQILTGLHARWTSLLRTLGPDAFARQLLHPERGPMTLDTLIQLYAWHGKHHAGHLRIVRQSGR
jgi:hypothetical protein